MDAPEIFCGKRLVVLGAGYVGGALVRAALGRGLRVTALTRNAEAAESLAALPGVEAVVADLASHAWHARVGAAEFAVNCVSSGGGGLAGYRHSYVEGMRSVLAWAAADGAGTAAGGGTLLYTSSTSVYPQDGGARVDEDAPTDGAGETAQVLREAERLLLAGHPRAFVLRLAGIYGPGRHHLLDQLRAGADTLPGLGDHRLNLIHRDDIVSGIFAALAASAAGSVAGSGSPERGVSGGIFNLADDHPVPKAELVGWLAARLGRPAPRFSGQPAGGRRAVTPDRIIDNTKARRVLGWRPAFPSFREGYAAILGGGDGGAARG